MNTNNFANFFQIQYETLNHGPVNSKESTLQVRTPPGTTFEMCFHCATSLGPSQGPKKKPFHISIENAIVTTIKTITYMQHFRLMKQENKANLVLPQHKDALHVSAKIEMASYQTTDQAVSAASHRPNCDFQIHWAHHH